MSNEEVTLLTPGPDEHPELAIIRPAKREDPRGYFVELFRADEYARYGLPPDFVQDNLSESRAGVLRGLHFQYDPPMGKLMRVSSGRALLVARDMRPASPTFGRVYSFDGSDNDIAWFWAPYWFARGFLAMGERTVIHYKCTATYNGSGEAAVRWNDSSSHFEWPTDAPILSLKDATAPSLEELAEAGVLDRLA